MPDGDIRYETKTVTTVRGLEDRSITKWEKEGWEFLSQQEQPLLRTSLTFRRVKPKPPWLLIGGLGSVLVVLAAIITVMSLITGDSEDGAEPAASPTAATPSQAPTPAPTQATATATATAEAPADVPAYSGQPYEIVSVDRGQTSANLTQYWVVADGIDASTPAGRDQIKAIVTDIARAEGSSALLVEVVNNRDIALAESPSTYEAFIEERGLDYAQKTIPPMEKTSWVASYAGGFDYNAGQASESAFEITWLPASDDLEIEAWEAVPTLR